MDWMDIETKAWIWKRAHKELWVEHNAKSGARRFAERLMFWGFVYMSVNIYIRWCHNHYHHFLRILLDWFGIKI